MVSTKPTLTRVWAVEGRTVFAIRNGMIDPSRCIGRDVARNVTQEGEEIDLSIGLYRCAVASGDLSLIAPTTETNSGLAAEKGSE